MGRAVPHADDPATNRAATVPVARSLDVAGFSRAYNVTPATVFQGAFQLWLAEHTGRAEASFDYLLTDRNVDLPEPQSINRTCANFLPFRVAVNCAHPLADFLAETQDFFWGATAQAGLGLQDIYAAAGLDRDLVGNRVLFLFQPFELDTGPRPIEMRWVVLAESKSHMPQAYALVEEIHKTDDGGYKLDLKYDDSVYSACEVDGMA